MPDKLEIKYIVNSSIGIKGNVGFRFSFIFRLLDDKEIEKKVFSRWYEEQFFLINYYVFFSRMLNFIRIYLFRKFPSQKVDDWCFLKLEQLYNLIGGPTDMSSRRLLHTTVYSPEMIDRHKKLGYQVILDVPIAPSLTAAHLTKLVNYSFEFDEDLFEREKKCFELCDLIFVPSSFVRNELVQKYNVLESKIHLVSFGVDLKEFCPVSDFKRDADSLTFVFSGALNERKGISVLLEAWDDPAFYNDRLILCGRVFPWFLDKLKKLSNTKNIFYPGFVDVRQFLHRADIFVFPSYLEGSAKSVYEAMACGLPVITTANAGSIVEDGYSGLIVKVGSVSDLQNGMLRLKRSPELRARIGQTAVEVVAGYSWENYACGVMQGYLRCLKK